MTYCIFDSDYHPLEAIRTRYAEAKQRGISLHIWQQKELENYVLVPTAIHRAITVQLTNGAIGPSLKDVEMKLQEIAVDLKQDVIDCVATQIQSADRKLTAATANQRAREIVADKWNTDANRLGVIPGKEALSRVSRWVQEKFKVSVSGQLIAYHMLARELPKEMQEVLVAIEECEPFPELK